MSIKAYLQGHFRKFHIFSPDARRLLKANLLFGFLIPFYLIFSNTFIFGNTGGDIRFNLLYSVMHFVGSPLGNLVAGVLLRRFALKPLYAVGLLLIVLNLLVMVNLPSVFFTPTAVLFFGLFSGLGSGIYWAVRNYLTVIATEDENRNFFAGLDQMFIVLGGIGTPFVIGNYIGLGTRWGLFTRAWAYQSAILLAFVLVIISIRIIYSGNYGRIHVPRFLHFRFRPEWGKARLYASVIGMYQAAYMAVPALLVMRFVGDESAVGLVDSLAQAFTAVMVYLISSRAKPEHRAKVVGLGVLISLSGATFFSIGIHQWSALAVVVLIVAFYLTDPTLNFPYRASFMKMVDKVRTLENRDILTYVVDQEQFIALGRFVSIGLLFLLLNQFSEIVAFSVYLCSVSASQLLGIWLARNISRLPLTEPVSL